MKIEILGSGCAKCKTLMKNTEIAVSNLKLEAEIIKVEDINKIINYGVMMTPALVVDGEIKAKGKLLGTEEIEKILKEIK